MRVFLLVMGIIVLLGVVSSCSSNDSYHQQTESNFESAVKKGGTGEKLTPQERKAVNGIVGDSWEKHR